MAQKERLRVTIVNKNYPPNPGITGESANELALWLIQKGHKVKIIHTDGQYAGGGHTTQPSGEVFSIRSVYDGKNKIIRLFASFIESYRLIKKAKTDGEGLLIIMTDPPFLILWSALLLKRRKWAYWSMDLYPEAFVAGKLVTENNFLYKFFKKVVRNNPPSYLIALGEFQLRFLQRDFQANIPSTILPCGINKSVIETYHNLPHWKKNDGKIYIGYCGNLGEAHSLEFILTVIELLNPDKYTMILSVYGSKAAAALQFAQTKPGVIITERVERYQLAFIDIHLVTLLPQWNNVCVPSKAVSAACEGGVILFCGNKENDNWHYLQQAGWIIEEGEGMEGSVRTFLSNTSHEAILEKKVLAAEISVNMHSIKKKAFESISIFAAEANK